MAEAAETGSGVSEAGRDDNGPGAAEIAAGHARHYAALLTQEEPGTPGWQFVFGQLSAASTLAGALASRRARACREEPPL